MAKDKKLDNTTEDKQEENTSAQTDDVDTSDDKNEKDTTVEAESKNDKEKSDDSEKAKEIGMEDNESLIVINDDIPGRAKWYVVHTYSGHEKKVASLIEAKVLGHGMNTKVFRILIPTQKKIVVADGKKRHIDERLFPGYIIVNMVMDDDAWYLVRSTKGVTGFVGTGDTPTPLPQKEVDTLMKFMTMEPPKFEAKFRVGDSVKINEGPFQDFLGKVDEVNDDQGKVRVLVSFFGKETPVELDFIQISSI